MDAPSLVTLFDAALRGTLVALLALVAALLARDRPPLWSARIGVVLMLALIVQVVSSTPAFESSVPRLWQTPLVAISVGNAVLFWIFVKALCDDDFAPRPWHVAAWLLVAALGAFNCATGWNTADVPGRISVAVQRSVPLLCALLAAIAAGSTWRLDLVEKRRRLRIFIVAAGIVYTVASLGARLASPDGRLLGTTATLDVAALLAIVAVMAVALLRVGPSELFPVPATTASPPLGHAAPTAPAGAAAGEAGADDDAEAAPEPGDDRLVAALDGLVRDERIYRLEGLTVAGLAGRLSVPEYRLRRVINRRLGHRNFNAFINGFRLDEAQRALRDPGQRALPVLTIALEAGFQSIGPFNRAFKAATGVTPTEFRRQHSAET
jgi:AraC-like DNA-binding protein